MKNVEFRKIFGFIPVPIFWTEKTLKDWQGGYSVGFFCVIRPKYRERGDEGIVQHELTHCKQFYKRFPLHGLLYRFNDTYRMNAECEAYAVQLKNYPERAANFGWMVDAMATKYNLKFSRDFIEIEFRRHCSEVGIDVG